MAPLTRECSGLSIPSRSHPGDSGFEPRTIRLWADTTIYAGCKRHSWKLFTLVQLPGRQSPAKRHISFVLVWLFGENLNAQTARGHRGPACFTSTLISWGKSSRRRVPLHRPISLTCCMKRGSYKATTSSLLTRYSFSLVAYRPLVSLSHPQFPSFRSRTCMTNFKNSHFAATLSSVFQSWTQTKLHPHPTLLSTSMWATVAEPTSKITVEKHFPRWPLVDSQTFCF